VPEHRSCLRFVAPGAALDVGVRTPGAGIAAAVGVRSPDLPSEVGLGVAPDVGVTTPMGVDPEVGLGDPGVGLDPVVGVGAPVLLSAAVLGVAPKHGEGTMGVAVASKIDAGTFSVGFALEGGVGGPVSPSTVAEGLSEAPNGGRGLGLLQMLVLEHLWLWWDFLFETSLQGHLLACAWED